MALRQTSWSRKGLSLLVISGLDFWLMSMGQKHTERLRGFCGAPVHRAHDLFGQAACDAGKEAGQLIAVCAVGWKQWLGSIHSRRTNGVQVLAIVRICWASDKRGGSSGVGRLRGYY